MKRIHKLSALILSLVIVSACALQGEGQRCDIRNNDGDCDTGLVCVSKDVLKSNSDICCPPDLNSSVVDCIPGGGTTSSSSSGTTSSSSSSSSGTTTSSSSSSSGAGGTGGAGGAGGAG